jgi:hypothetical protein
MILQDLMQVVVSLSHKTSEERDYFEMMLCALRAFVDIILTKCLCHAGKRFKSTVWAFLNTFLSCVCAHLSTIIQN